jgi:POT family proton-dependent oligopeptide transporter
MFKGHPAGLPVLFFSNMGERFGYYTMLSIFVLFLEARFGLTTENMGMVWSGFLFAVYFLPVLGGFLADRIGYGRTVLAGIGLLLAGYGLLAVPSEAQWFLYVSLFVVALGTGFFKGNMVVLLGNLYDDPRFRKHHDAAFNIYYMGINIGAFFSPYAATGIRDFLLARAGFSYDARIPGMAHQFQNGTLPDVPALEGLARAQAGAGFTDVAAFCHQYLDALSAGYNAGFGIAALAIVVSLIVFLSFRRHYSHADVLRAKAAAGSGTDDLTPQQVRERVVALFMVFCVVIFFWMAFHQNGLTLTWFAKNYTAGQVDRGMKALFDLPALLAGIGAIIGVVLLVLKGGATRRGLGALLLIAGAALVWWRFSGFAAVNPIAPELFQAFNPIFVVFLTPVVLWFFGRLAARGREPSSPRKIAWGMLIASLAYLLMVAPSFGLTAPRELAAVGGVSDVLRDPFWLIGTYLTLTVAELLLSPMGLSFVARVSPPRYRGLMQGGWLAATAIGNLLAGLVAIPYARLELWQTFGLLVGTSAMSAVLIFAILRRLEAATR